MTPILLSACQNWKEFKTSEGDFSIMMPGAPTYDKIASNTSLGYLDTNNYTVTSKKATYIISYADYPDSLINMYTPEKILDTAEDSVVAKSQFILRNESNITLNNYPGREYRLESTDGKSIYIVRAYLVSHRFYLLIIVTSKDDQFSSVVTKYMDSFKLIPK
jgi:hypothetical protein